MLVEALEPMLVKSNGRVLFDLRPGKPMDLPEEQALKLLVKAPGQVKVCSPDVVVEPAAMNARPVYWEGVTGDLLGPAVPEYLGRTGSGHEERFWVVVRYQNSIRWIRADRLVAGGKR